MEDHGRRVLVWHVHGSWTSAFVSGRHEYLVPRLPEGGPWGLGKCGRDWPSAHELTPSELAEVDIDVVVLQRVEEIELTRRWLGRRPGVDLPAVYVEHNTPAERPVTTRHPMAEQCSIPLVHVTHFNDLVWDSGRCPRRVIPHGIVDPGALYTGELGRVAVMINEPARRGRVVGTDLLPRFADVAPIDVYGIEADSLGNRDPIRGRGDLTQLELHRQVASRRVYLHTARWTSLGLSLIEAMHLGLPVVSLATTEAAVAVPPEAGVLSTDVEQLRTGLRRFLADPDLAAATGKFGREFALAHFGLPRFLSRWDDLLGEVAAGAFSDRQSSGTPILSPETL
jgi:hypothetical protein